MHDINISLAGRNIEAVACFDSFGKMSMILLASCRRWGAKTTLHLLELPSRTMSRRQRLEISRIDPKTTIKRHKWSSFQSIAGAMTGRCDALLLGLDGQRSREAMLALQSCWGNADDRPLLVSAYPGILFRHQMEGMLDRSGVDLLCLNSCNDEATYRMGCDALGVDASNAIVTGLPLLWNLTARRQVPEQSSIVFFEQPSIPNNPLQRHYICKQLQEIALDWPSHPVIFKPRTSSTESTLHRRHGEMVSKIRKLARHSKNLQISLQPAAKLLSDCGCAITLSSTAALEAMAMGVSTRIVADLGVNETLGNSFFTGSGCLAAFDRIRHDPFSIRHRDSWLEQHGYCSDGEIRFLTALAERLLDSRRRLCGPGGGPPGWGSISWQNFALSHGGKAMLSSAGRRSAQRKRNRTSSLLRRIRDYFVRLSWLDPWLRAR